jgi:hypothetical protein
MGEAPALETQACRRRRPRRQCPASSRAAKRCTAYSRMAILGLRLLLLLDCRPDLLGVLAIILQPLFFPKIISARSDDAIRIRLRSARRNARRSDPIESRAYCNSVQRDG